MTKLNKKHGFTLLELLIAMFIFTIVAMILATALHNVINTQSAAEKKSDRFAELQIALLILSRDVEQTVNRPIMNIGTIEPALKGNKHVVEFTHGGFDNPFGQLPRSTLQRTRYEILNHNLVRTSWQALDRTTETKATQRTLLKSVTDLQFEYVDHTSHLQTTWPPQLQQKPFTPRAVRVSLTLPDWGKISQIYLIPGQPFEKPQ